MKNSSLVFRSLLLSLFIFSTNSCGQNTQPSEREQLEEALKQVDSRLADGGSRIQHQRAEILFRLERFEESVTAYDEAVKIKYPHNNDSCWERGLAQYYADDFEAGRDQFLRYHNVGALDIENGLWRLMCIAEDEGIEKARDSVLDYPNRVRVPFPALLDLYLGKGSPEAVIEQASDDAPAGRRRTANLFNAHYYIAKYYEMIDEYENAEPYIQNALEHQIPHFMYYCAQIDAKRISAELAKEENKEQP
jgi:lipoprotein NlpI